MSEMDNEFTSQNPVSNLTESADLVNSECNISSNVDFSASTVCFNADFLNSNKKQDGDSLAHDNKAYSVPVLTDSHLNNRDSCDSNEAVVEPIPESPSCFSVNVDSASNLNHNMNDDLNFKTEESKIVTLNYSNVPNDVLRLEEKLRQDEQEREKQSMDDTSDALQLTDDCEVEKMIIIKIADDEPTSRKQTADEASDEIKEFQLSYTYDIEKIREIVAESELQSRNQNVHETSDKIKALQLPPSCETKNIIGTVVKDEHESGKQNEEETSGEIKAVELRQKCETDKILETIAEEELFSANQNVNETAELKTRQLFEGCELNKVIKLIAQDGYESGKQSVNETADVLKTGQLADNCEMKKTIKLVAENEYESGELNVDEASDGMKALKLADNCEILSMSPRNNTTNQSSGVVFNLNTDNKIRCLESVHTYSSECQEGSLELQNSENRVLPDDLKVINLHASQLMNANTVSDENYVDIKLKKHDHFTKFDFQENQLKPSDLSNPKTEATSQSVNHNYQNALKYFQNLSQLPPIVQKQTSEGYFQIRKQQNKCAELVTDIQNVKKMLADVKSDIGELKSRCAQVKNTLKDMANGKPRKHISNTKN